MMKIIAITLLVTAVAAQAAATTYPADSLYCLSYTSATVCTACPTAGNMSIGVRKLASNSCATARVNLVTKNPKKVWSYTGTDVAMTAIAFTCQDGYYAFWSSTATQVGCYSSSEVDSNTTLFGANAKTAKVIANCASFAYANSTFTCNFCKGSFSPNTAGTACVANSIANCEYGGAGLTCARCKGGWVANSTNKLCQKEAKLTKNCTTLNTAGTLCDTCYSSAAFTSNGSCKSYNAGTIAFSMLAILAVALLN